MEGSQFVNKNNSDAIFLTSYRIKLKKSLNPTHFISSTVTFQMIWLEIEGFTA